MKTMINTQLSKPEPERVTDIEARHREELGHYAYVKREAWKNQVRDKVNTPVEKKPKRVRKAKVKK